MNWRKLSKSALFALPLMVFASFANADVVFNNGSPNQHNGNEMTDFLQSEDFTLGAAATVNSVTFWNLQGVPADYNGSIYWAIQADAAGTPGGIIASGTTAAVTRAATGLFATNGFAEFSNIFSIAPTALSAGPTYWLTLHDGPTSDSNFADFYWEWSNDNGNGEEFDLVQNTVWDSNLADHAFLLEGTTSAVPEPRFVSLLLMAIILGGLGIRKWQSLRNAD